MLGDVRLHEAKVYHLHDLLHLAFGHADAFAQNHVLHVLSGRTDTKVIGTATLRRIALVQKQFVRCEHNPMREFPHQSICCNAPTIEAKEWTLISPSSRTFPEPAAVFIDSSIFVMMRDKLTSFLQRELDVLEHIVRVMVICQRIYLR